MQEQESPARLGRFGNYGAVFCMKKSQLPGFIRVAELQQPFRIAAELGWPETLVAVVQPLVRSGKYSSAAAAVQAAGIHGPDFYRALKDNGSLSGSAISSLIGLHDEPERSLLGEQTDHAFFVRRAALHKTVAPIYRLSAYEIYSGRAISYERVSNAKDKGYWAVLLSRVMLSLGLEPEPVTASNAAKLTSILVDHPRNVLGESVALKNALINTLIIMILFRGPTIDWRCLHWYLSPTILQRR